jgi:hypothetical protein
VTDDELVALGDFCENLKVNPQFKVLTNQFELQIIHHFLNTAPHETKKREGIYASYSGVRDFLGNMDAIISQKEEIVNPKKEPSETDAQPQDFED